MQRDDLIAIKSVFAGLGGRGGKGALFREPAFPRAMFVFPGKFLYVFVFLFALAMAFLHRNFYQVCRIYVCLYNVAKCVYQLHFVCTVIFVTFVLIMKNNFPKELCEIFFN